jgi:hypothetical protein
MPKLGSRGVTRIHGLTSMYLCATQRHTYIRRQSPSIRRRMKATTALVLSAVLLTTITVFSPVFAQSNQVSYSVNLTYATIQVTYPSEALPGNNVTVNVQVNPKSNAYIQTLTATIYYIDDAGLHQVATQTLADNSKMMNYGYSYSTSSFSKSFQVTVPQNAPRTSLVAVFSETAQSTYYNNYYSNYYGYYGYGYPYWYYYEYPYNNSSYACNYYYCQYSYAYPAYYLAYYPSYPTTSTDNAIAPLSYIKASTPEYATLQSQYQSLQQQLQQSQAQNQQLQSTVSQQSTTISQLNQQLASSNSSSQTYQTLAIGLGILAAALAIVAAFRGRSRPHTIKSQDVEQKENQ